MLLFLSTSLLFAAPTEPVQRELVAITQALFDSIGSGNADFWAQALADDAFVIDEFGRRQEKPEIVRSIRPFPRMIEIISPGGFERYFEEVAQLLAADAPGRRERIEAVRKRYGLTFLVDANQDLVRRYGLNPGGSASQRPSAPKAEEK